MWFNRQKMNTGYNIREFGRLLSGKYTPESRSEYTEEEYYQLILSFEKSNKDRLDKKQERREQRQRQIQERKKRND